MEIVITPHSHPHIFWLQEDGTTRIEKWADEAQWHGEVCGRYEVKSVPNVGDLIRVYQYPPPDPDRRQINAWMGNPWQAPKDGWNIFRCWHLSPIVVMRRIRREHANGLVSVRLVVTSEDWTDELRNEGVSIPLHCAELEMPGYGLPTLTQRAEVISLDDARKKREEMKQGALL